MTERPRSPQDETGVEDAVQVVLKGPDGEIKHAEGVKGPDPEEWGADEERPSPFAGVEEAGAQPIPLGEVWREDLTERPLSELKELAKDHDISGRSQMAHEDLAAELSRRGVGVLKGPGPQWERDEDGRYVNR